jgi:Lrp/AsnC family transcriptional regulator for asnA, asnC and gidA
VSIFARRTHAVESSIHRHQRSDSSVTNILFVFARYFFDHRKERRMSSSSTSDRILDALEADAQASHAEIAERAGVSKPTVRKYIDQLEEEGVIVGYSAELDPKKLSGRTIAIVGIEAESDRYVEATRGLKEVDAIERLYTSSGDHMFMAEVRATDGEDLGNVISEEVLDVDGAEAAHPSVLQERLK